MNISRRFSLGLVTLVAVVGIVALGIVVIHSNAATPSVPPATPDPAGLCAAPAPTKIPSGPVIGGCIAPTPIIATGNSLGADGGIPAIKPQAGTANPAGAAFDAQTAQAYVLAHPSTGKVQSNGPATVVSVQFISAQQADDQLKTQSGLRPDRLICLVTLKGSFSVAGPPGTGVGTFTMLYRAFDAQTGNSIYQKSG